MSDPFEEEMLRRARQLCVTRGRRIVKVDKAYDVPYHAFKDDRLSVSIRESTNQVEVAMTLEWISGSWLIYYVDPYQPSESIFRPEHYEEAVELMRQMMILEDLADA